MTLTNSTCSRLATLFVGVALTGCLSNSYTASLSLSGVDHQKEVLNSADRLMQAEEAGEQAFVDAFDLFTRFTMAEGELDLKLYDELLERVDGCAEHVRAQRPHVMNFEGAGRMLFSSWDAELDQFSSPRLRERSEARMTVVRQRYEELMVQAVKSSAELETALVALRDYVLFFNHNLTPQAIRGLRQESEGFDAVIRSLRTQIDASRAAKNAFSTSLQGVSPGPVEEIDSIG